MSSISTFTTYQSKLPETPLPRRQAQPASWPTLNAAPCPGARIVAALLENNQTPDGIRIPAALHPYTGFRYHPLMTVRALLLATSALLVLAWGCQRDSDPALVSELDSLIVHLDSLEAAFAAIDPAEHQHMDSVFQGQVVALGNRPSWTPATGHCTAPQELLPRHDQVAAPPAR